MTLAKWLRSIYNLREKVMANIYIFFNVCVCMYVSTLYFVSV